jgi:YHS domain-containing protein
MLSSAAVMSNDSKEAMRDSHLIRKYGTVPGDEECKNHSDDGSDFESEDWMETKRKNEVRRKEWLRERRDRFIRLSIIALVVSLLFVFAVMLKDRGFIGGEAVRDIKDETKLLKKETIDAKNSCGEFCPDVVTSVDCTNAKYPVMGGLDMVQYFSFPNESYIGRVGYPDYQTKYMDYTFYFLNEENLKLFKVNPDKYAPSWGGFCAYGMAAEFCPDHYWNSHCLGPDGNWGLWTIQKDRLYFFYLPDVKEKFLESPNKYIDDGNNRWSNWFKQQPVVYNTQCYFKDPSERHQS